MEISNNLLSGFNGVWHSKVQRGEFEVALGIVQTFSVKLQLKV